MIELVVGPDQVQEPVPIEIELDTINVENMIICQGLSKFGSRKGIRADQTNVQYGQRTDSIKTLVTGTYDSLNRINSIDETVMDHLNL